MISSPVNQPLAPVQVNFVADDEPPLPLPIFVTRATLPAFLRPLSTQCESGQ